MRSRSFDEADEIVLGAVIPLSTGGRMLEGFAMQAAMSIAVDEVNQAGGVRGLPLRLVTYDSAGSAEAAVTAVNRLAREDCAVAVTGLLHNDAALAAAARGDAIGVPMVIAGATTDRVPEQQFANVFRIAPSDAMFAEMPAKWLVEVGDYNGDGALSVVNVVDSRKHDTPQFGWLEDKLSEFGIEYVTLPVDLPASDFSSVVARIASVGYVPDAIFIYVDGEAALELENQIRTVGGFGPQKQTLIVNGEAALDSVNFWRIVPDGVGTVVYRIGPWHKTVTSAGQTFALKYANYFGHWPEYYSFAAYDAVRLVADALERSESPVGPDVTDAVATSDTVLASGRYYFPYTSPRAAGEASVPPNMWNQWPDVHTLYLQYDETGQAASDMPVLWPQTYRTAEGPLAWSAAKTD